MDHQQHNSDQEEDLGDLRSDGGDSRQSQGSRDQSHQQEHQGIIKDLKLLSVVGTQLQKAFGVKATETGEPDALGRIGKRAG